MGDAPDEESAHGDVDHGFGDVEVALVVAHETTPTNHPAKSPLHDPAARDDLEAGFLVGAADDLDDEVKECGFVHEPAPVISAVGEEVLEPRPALADGIDDGLRSGAVRHIGRCKVDHQPPPVGDCQEFRV